MKLIVPCKAKGLDRFSALSLDDTQSASGPRLSISSSDNATHEESAGTVGRHSICPSSDDVEMTSIRPVEQSLRIHLPTLASLRSSDHSSLRTHLPLTPTSFT